MDKTTKHRIELLIRVDQEIVVSFEPLHNPPMLYFCLFLPTLHAYIESRNLNLKARTFQKLPQGGDKQPQKKLPERGLYGQISCCLMSGQKSILLLMHALISSYSRPPHCTQFKKHAILLSSRHRAIQVVF